jgi:hypothetical protein
VVWLVSITVSVVVSLVAGDVGDLPWFPIVVIGGDGVAVVVRRRRLHRAVELNSGPPA